MTFGQVLLAVTVLVLSFVALGYNRFVRTRAHLRESWSGIDVERRRRGQHRRARGPDPRRAGRNADTVRESVPPPGF